MADQFELEPELQARVTELASDLSQVAQEARDAFDERSERWQEGKDGMAADAWIEAIADLGEALENLPVKAE